MPSYTVKRFGGSVPRMAPHLLGPDTAIEALDCKLWHGRLESWREPLLIRDYGVPEHLPVNTALFFDCCWLEFGNCVDIALGPVTCRKLFTTGDQDWPAVIDLVATTETPCGTNVRRLGVPAAYTAPSVVLGSLGASAPKDTETRSYAYQYQNAAKERGALSRASEPENMRDGQTVVVSGWDVPGVSWGITDVLIYRSVKGYQAQGKDKGNALDITWMLVGSAAIGAGSFTDNKLNEVLANALEDDIADPPPANMRGIVHLDSMNCLAGFVGRRVYFSENNLYHQWPHHLDLDDNICGLVESNGALYVATDGAPYVVAMAVDPKDGGGREAIKLPGKYPMVGCGNRRMAATPNGAVFPTHDGLVHLSGKSEPSLLTFELYAPDDWQRKFPETITPVTCNGKLFVFARAGSFVMNLPNGPQSPWPLDTHSTLSDVDVLDAFVTRNGELYLLKEAGVYQWDRSAVLRPHRWVSPESVAPTPLNFGAANMFHQGAAETMTITNDARQTFSRSVSMPKAFRLPNWMLGTRWRVKLEGTASVSLFSMATSMHELGA